MIVTCQARVRDYAELERAIGDAALSAYAGLYGRVERKLFAEVASGRPVSSLKREYLRRYRIPARMFNGVRALEGKTASVREQQKLRLDSLGRRIARAQRQITGAIETAEVGLPVRGCGLRQRHGPHARCRRGLRL